MNTGLYVDDTDSEYRNAAIEWP